MCTCGGSGPSGFNSSCAPPVAGWPFLLACCPLNRFPAERAQGSCQCCKERPRLAVQGNLCAPRKRGAQLYGGSPVLKALLYSSPAPVLVFSDPGEAQQPDDSHLAVAFACSLHSKVLQAPSSLRYNRILSSNNRRRLAPAALQFT